MEGNTIYSKETWAMNIVHPWESKEPIMRKVELFTRKGSRQYLRIEILSDHDLTNLIRSVSIDQDSDRVMKPADETRQFDGLRTYQEISINEFNNALKRATSHIIREAKHSSLLLIDKDKLNDKLEADLDTLAVVIK